MGRLSESNVVERSSVVTMSAHDICSVMFEWRFPIRDEFDEKMKNVLVNSVITKKENERLSSERFVFHPFPELINNFCIVYGKEYHAFLYDWDVDVNGDMCIVRSKSNSMHDCTSRLRNGDILEIYVGDDVYPTIMIGKNIEIKLYLGECAKKRCESME